MTKLPSQDTYNEMSWLETRLNIWEFHSLMGKFSRDKGARNERELVNHWRGLGVDPAECLRVPLSGAMDGYRGDVRLAGHVVELKVRATGFKNLYSWLEGAPDLLVVKADNSERLYVIPESLMIKWAKRMGWLGE